MVSDDVTRRGVMKGIGVMTGASLTEKGKFGARRDDTTESTESTESNECSVSTPDSLQVWPQSGGTAARIGRRQGAIGPKSTVAYRWRIDGNPTISGVVVADDTVYASDETTLRALTAEDGSEVWTVGGDGKTAMCTPAVDDSLVYVGETRIKNQIQDFTPDGIESRSRQSRVVTLDAATGKEVWEFEPERRVSRFYSPTVTDGIVYIVGRNFGAGSVGQLYALDGGSGELLWKQETGASGISGYEAPPVAVESGVVYLAAGELFALDAQTGEVYWSSDPESGTYRATGQNSPAVADGQLYIGRGTDPTLEARSIVDGSRVWTHDAADDVNGSERTRTGVWTGSAVDNDTVYVGFNERRIEQKSTVYALAVDDGTVRWRTTFSDDRLSVYTPAIADGMLYTGGAALRLDDGSVRWRLDAPSNTSSGTSGTSHSPPAIADETVYVGGETLRAITGRI